MSETYPLTFETQPEPEIVGEKPTAMLRWRNGVLEMMFERTTHRSGYSMFPEYDWRPVPVVTDEEAR